MLLRRRHRRHRSAGSECGTALCRVRCRTATSPSRTASFLEFYAKGVYTFNDNFNIGAGVFYTEDWLNTGADGTYANVTAKFIGTGAAERLGLVPVGRIRPILARHHRPVLWRVNFPTGTPLPDYSTWNVGLGFTYKVFTLDFRYYDTNLTKAECNVLTADHTAYGSSGNITPINPGGLPSKWCGADLHRQAVVRPDLEQQTSSKADLTSTELRAAASRSPPVFF